MGGKALKSIDVVRLNKPGFLALEQEVLSILRQKFSYAQSTTYYKDKESFGDLDVIVPRPIPNDILKFLKEKFNPQEIFYDGKLMNCFAISFDYKNFQVDLIFNNPENLEIAQFYYSYNDLNNYIGRFAAAFGCKFGFDGFRYVMDTDQIMISKNPKKIYEFLGMDWQRYLQGFSTLEEIFSYIIQSKYFNSELFQYENLNHINRSRNKKRPNYEKFLNFLDENGIHGGFIFPEGDFASQIDAYFPEANLKWKIQELKNKRIREAKSRELLNSTIVNQVMNLNDNWKIIRHIIDQIYAHPGIDRVLPGLKPEQINKLINAAYSKVINSPEIKVENGQIIQYTNGSHEYLQGKVIDQDSETLLVATPDYFFDRIKKDKFKLIENWIDVKAL